MFNRLDFIFKYEALGFRHLKALFGIYCGAHEHNSLVEQCYDTGAGLINYYVLQFDLWSKSHTINFQTSVKETPFTRCLH